MTVRLITTIKNFVGLSTDGKPTSGVPAGSTFLETNTGDTYVYSAAGWSLYGYMVPGEVTL